MPYTSSAEDQRRDDRFDQAQENVGERGHPLRFADVRKDRAQRDSQQHGDEDPGRQRQPLHRSPHFSFSRSTSKKNIFGGRIRCTLMLGAAADHAIVLRCSGSPTCPSTVR